MSADSVDPTPDNGAPDSQAQPPPPQINVAETTDDEAKEDSSRALAPLVPPSPSSAAPSPALSPTPPPRPNKGSLRAAAAGGGMPSPLLAGTMVRSTSQPTAEAGSASAEAESPAPLSPSISRASSASVSAASAPRPAIPPRPISTARDRGSSAAHTPHSATAASSSTGAAAAAAARSHRLHPPAPVTEPSSPTSKDDDRPVFDRFRSFLKRMTVSSDTAPAPALAGFAANKTAYTQMMFLLQHEPRYLATLARLLQPRGDSIPQFVQTVVFDIFGESAAATSVTAASAFANASAVGVQQLSIEERLLLRLLKTTLFTEMQTCTDRATLLRSNSALTQMLSAYAKRSEGSVILRRILQEPLMQICEAPELKNANLELQPLKIHNQLIATWKEAQEAVEQEDTPAAAPPAAEATEGEDGSAAPTPSSADAAKTGCPFNAAVSTDAEALAVPFVAAIVESRVNLLVHCCDLVMDRILESADVIPLGMRWIVRVMAELYRERFAHASTNSPSAAAASAASAAAASTAAAALPPPALLGSLPESIAEHPESEAAESASAAADTVASTTAASSSAASAASISRVEFDASGLPLSPSSRSSLSSEIQSLQGGYLMLRFFNPAIVAPEGSKLVVTRPSKQLQRNLVLIAKVLQNLSNGVEFGGKESYMSCVNSYITQKAPQVKAFYRAIESGVGDLEPEQRAMTAPEYKAAAAAHAQAAASAEAAATAASSSSAAASSLPPAAAAAALVPPPVGARATLAFHLSPRVGAMMRLSLSHLYSLHSVLLAYQDHLCFSPAFPTDEDDDDPLAVLLARIPPPPTAVSTAAAPLSAKDKEKLAEVVVLKLTEAEVQLATATDTAAAAASTAPPRDRAASAIVPSSPAQKSDASSSSAAAAAPAPAGGGVLTQAKSIFSTAMRKLKM